MPPLARTLLPSLLSLLSLSASAQQAVAEATPQEPIQRIDIKADAAAYDARRDDTATRIVVKQAEILRYGDTALGDVLRRVPGITIGGAPGRGGEIRMRGLGNGYTQILLNGEPSPPGFAIGSLAPDMVERIEILRAATAEYSTQAIAGTINIVLKRAIATAQRDIKPGIRLDHGAAGGALQFQLSDRDGDHAYAVGGGVNASASRRQDTGSTTVTAPSGRETTRRETAARRHGIYRAVNVAPRASVSLGPDDAVTAQGFINATRYAGPWQSATVTLFGAPPAFAVLDGAVKDATDAWRTDLSWVHKLAGDATLEVKTGGNATRRVNDQRSRNFQTADVLALYHDIRTATRDHGWTSSGKLRTAPAKGHAFAGGWDGASSVRSDTRRQRERSPIGAPATDLDQAYVARVSRLALFAQDEWTVNAQWSGYLGVRWEGVWTRGGGGDGTPIDNAASVWSPLFQALYKLSGAPANQVRLALTRTFKAPTPGMLVPRRVNADNNTATTPDTQGNPALRPELATGLDLAFEHFLAGGGLVSASAYLRSITDHTRNDSSLVEELWVAMPINTGVARTRGIALEASFGLRSWHKRAPAIDVRASLARNWSTLDGVPGPHNRLAGQTPFSANLGLDYKAGRLPVTMGASYSFQNGGPVRFSAHEFDYATPKRVVDLYALVKFDARRQLRILVANALHQDDMTATTWVDHGGVLSDASIAPTSTVLRVVLELKL